MAERRPRKARAAAAPEAPEAPAAPAAPGRPTGSLRGRVPALSPEQAEALRAFHAEPRRWPLRDGGVLQVEAVHGTRAGEAFAVDADGVRIAVRFDAGGRAGDLHWSDHVGRSRILAWTLAHEAQLVRLSEALGVSLLPQVDAVPGDDAGGTWLDFLIHDVPADDTPAPTRGAMRVPWAWLPRLAAQAEPRYEDEPPPPLGAWRALPVPVSVAMAIPAVSARDWRGLRPGDAIVVGRSGRPPSFQARAAGRAWPLAQSPSGWRVEGPAQALPATPSQENSTMSENDAGEGTPQDPARALPVRLEFEIGQIELSVGELADLQPGYVFALPAHLEGANVVIRANGRATGRGEVVAVGETLGVRLLSWS
jgi:type III secretion protein Q